MDPPDILFWCCSRQWCWCYLNWKWPGAVCVEFSSARQWGDTAILPIFSDIDVNFCFHEEYFPPTTFFISYQYRGTNIWVFKMRQNWNFCFDGKSVTTTKNNWTCARGESFCVAKKTKGSCSSKFQRMTLSQNALVLHTTHQPAKPVETNNTSHVFVAERIKPKPLNKNNPLNVEAAKNKANVPHSELKGSAPAHSVRI